MLAESSAANSLVVTIEDAKGRALKYYAPTAEDAAGHRHPDESRWQLLKDHFRAVAELARKLSRPLGLANEVVVIRSSAGGPATVNPTVSWRVALWEIHRHGTETDSCLDWVAVKGQLKV